tara:strand:- start:89 stop:301 length:213 start_codon:yes stop_codon:yes gene_type:complete
MINRINKTNRPQIHDHIVRYFNAKSKARGNGTVSLIDVWDVGYEIEKRFNISDPASQKITWEVLRENKRE